MMEHIGWVTIGGVFIIALLIYEFIAYLWKKFKPKPKKKEYTATIIYPDRFDPPKR